MSTNYKKSSTRLFLEKLRGGPLTFGGMIRSFRLADDVSQMELADRMRISKANLCDIEHGRRPVSIERAAQFAKTMGYSETQFIAVALEDQLRDAGFEAHIELKVEAG